MLEYMFVLLGVKKMYSFIKDSNIINYGITVFKNVYSDNYNSKNLSSVVESIELYRSRLVDFVKQLALYERIMFFCYVKGICTSIEQSIVALSRLLINEDNEEDEITAIFVDNQDSIKSQINEMTAELNALNLVIDVLKEEFPDKKLFQSLESKSLEMHKSPSKF